MVSCRDVFHHRQQILVAVKLAQKSDGRACGKALTEIRRSYIMQRRRRLIKTNVFVRAALFRISHGSRQKFFLGSILITLRHIL